MTRRHSSKPVLLCLLLQSLSINGFQSTYTRLRHVMTPRSAASSKTKTTHTPFHSHPTSYDNLKILTIQRMGETSTTVTAAEVVRSRNLWKPENFLPDEQEKLKEYQIKAQQISSSYQVTPFNPYPLLTNCHVQTLSGVFLRKNPSCTYWDGISTAVKLLWNNNSGDSSTDTLRGFQWDERKRFDTPDGDFFDVDYKYCGRDEDENDDSSSISCSRGMVILVHGLESDSQSPLSRDMAKSFWMRGFDVACINFRGCSGEPNLTVGCYHLGFTDDLKLLLKTMENRKKPLYLSGFSLGANVVLKLLGELGESAQEFYNIQGAAVSGAPFFTELNYLMMQKPGINTLVYTNNFLRTMKEKGKEQFDKFDGNVPFDIERILGATDIATIEDSFIAPIYGFESNMDYYRRTSCGHFIGGITVPTLVINAKDDPFFDPTVVAPLPEPSPIQYVRTDHGGHLGFMFHQGKTEDKSTSWMSTELGKFIEHVDKSL